MHLRNVLILAASQALGQSAASLIVFIGGILGAELSPSPVWATLPVTVMVVGVALFTFPASLLMKRIGRARGFMAGAVMAALAALGAAYAISIQSFSLFCAAIFFIGGNLAFVQQYRFAAAESVQPDSVGRAISIVLLGGIAAGFLGPEIGNWTKDWLSFGEYSGSFASLAVLYLILVVLLSFLSHTRPVEGNAEGRERPLRLLLMQPTYLVALLGGVVAYGSMSMIMTATPVSMHTMDGHSLADTGRVIQSHVVAMYLPSLFTGYILARNSPLRVMMAGIGFLFICILFTLLGRGIFHYWSALVMLGLGWNFLFLGGTVLLTQSHRPSERFKAQAFNDFLIFGIQALASLSAGSILHLTGWDTLTALNLPLLLALLIAIFSLQRSFRQQRLRQPAGD